VLEHLTAIMQAMCSGAGNADIAPPAFSEVKVCTMVDCPYILVFDYKVIMNEGDGDFNTCY